MSIFLAPRSNETSYKNFLSTIENGVDYSIMEPHLSEEGKKILGEKGKIFAWGTKETKKTSWDKMKKGDLVLFYKGKDGEESEGKFLYAGKLIFKQHNDDLGISLWPPKLGEEPWNCVFFLDNLQPIYIPLSEIVHLGGYSETLDRIQSFMPLNEQGNTQILKKFGSFEAFLSHYPRRDSEIDSEIESTPNEITAHSQAELLLLKMGKMLGYDTYSPDKSKNAYDEDLADYITLKEIPSRFFGSEELLALVKNIDVIWFKNQVPEFAFEVEHTTNFISGFQRLYQLAPLHTKLFIISSKKNSYLFEKFINSDPYYQSKSNFGFRSYKQLEAFFFAVSQFSKLNDVFLK